VTPAVNEPGQCCARIPEITISAPPSWRRGPQQHKAEAPRRRQSHKSSRQRFADRSEPLTNRRWSTSRNAARSRTSQCALAGSVITARQPVSSRSRSNPGPARSARRNLDRRIADRALGDNRAPDRNRCSNWPLACIDTLQSGNYLRAKLIVLAAALPPQNAEFLSLLQLHYSSKVAN
jgi:hypothetical protein